MLGLYMKPCTRSWQANREALISCVAAPPGKRYSIEHIPAPHLLIESADRLAAYIIGRGAC
jgi:hypothetical protein